MIYFKTREEIELIRQSALLVSKTLGLLATLIKPGVSTLYLDKIAEEFIRDNHAKPGFKGYKGYPNTLCTSVNEGVVHGIPNKKPLVDGDIISVDCGVLMNGYYGDHAYTFSIGEISSATAKLLKITKESLYLGIAEAKLGKRIGDISNAIQSHVRQHGYGIVRDLTGHGMGKNLHEDPTVPNYGQRGKGAKIENGLVLAIEPMINMGRHNVRQLGDGWTVITADKKPSAHFEHDIAIVDGKAEILSTFEYIDQALQQTSSS